jgi:hypothetical protein
MAQLKLEFFPKLKNFTKIIPILSFILRATKPDWIQIVVLQDYNIATAIFMGKPLFFPQLHPSGLEVMKSALSGCSHADPLSPNNAHKPMLLSGYYTCIAFGTCPLFVRLTHLHARNVRTHMWQGTMFPGILFDSGSCRGLCHCHMNSPGLEASSAVRLIKVRVGSL